MGLSDRVGEISVWLSESMHVVIVRCVRCECVRVECVGCESV